LTPELVFQRMLGVMGVKRTVTKSKQVSKHFKVDKYQHEQNSL